MTTEPSAGKMRVSHTCIARLTSATRRLRHADAALKRQKYHLLTQGNVFGLESYRDFTLDRATRSSLIRNSIIGRSHHTRMASLRYTTIPASTIRRGPRKFSKLGGG
jgi:hypothetical protein